MAKRITLFAILAAMSFLFFGFNGEAFAAPQPKIAYEINTTNLIKLLLRDKNPRGSVFFLFKVSSSRGHYLPAGTELQVKLFKIDSLNANTPVPLGRFKNIICGERGAFKDVKIEVRKGTVNFVEMIECGFKYEIQLSVSPGQKKAVLAEVGGLVGLAYKKTFQIGGLGEISKGIIDDAETWVESLPVWEALCDAGKDFTDEASGRKEKELEALCKAFKGQLDKLNEKEYEKDIVGKIKTPYFRRTDDAFKDFIQRVRTNVGFVARREEIIREYPNPPVLDFSDSYFYYVRFRFVFMTDFIHILGVLHKRVSDSQKEFELYPRSIWDDIAESDFAIGPQLKKLFEDVFDTQVFSDAAIEWYKKHRILPFLARYGGYDAFLPRVQLFEEFLVEENVAAVRLLAGDARAHIETILDIARTEARAASKAIDETEVKKPQVWLPEEMNEKSDEIQDKLNELSDIIDAACRRP